MKYKSFEANHKCYRPKSIRILKNYNSNKYSSFGLKEGWHMLQVKKDCDWQSVYTSDICPITFCPFCGKELN